MPKKTFDTVAIFGNNTYGPGSPGPDYQCVRGIAADLVRNGVTNRVICNGGYGIVEAAALGATEAEGEAVGYTLGIKSVGNQFLTENVVCGDGGLGLQLGTQLGHLLEADASIAFWDGSLDIMVEILSVINLIQKSEEGQEKPIVIFCTTRKADETFFLIMKTPGIEEFSYPITVAARFESVISCLQG